MEYKLEHLESISESSTKVLDELSLYPCSSTSSYLLEAFPLEAPCKKRKRASPMKTRVNDSKSLQKLKCQQEELLNSTSDLPETESKRLQQLIRNRISAQQSRDRKKYYVQRLEQDNQDLRRQNSELLARLEKLESENKYLKNELIKLHTEEALSFHNVSKAATLTMATVLSIMVMVHSFDEEDLIDLEQFKDKNGVSFKQAAEQVIKDMNISLEAFLPHKNNSLNKIDKFRNPLATSLYCPNSVGHWSTGTHMQLFFPAAAVDRCPGTSEDLIEIVSKISEVKVLKIN